MTRLYKVIGRVQGVGFRNFTWRTAMALGIRGYVKIFMMVQWKCWHSRVMKAEFMNLKIDYGGGLLLQGR